MQMLYNSDSFTVVQFDLPAPEGSSAPPRGGFEIVDKLTRREIFIDGLVADGFRQGVQALIDRGDGGASVEALDDYIGGFTVLAPHPIFLH